jgi:hypothetical protein
LIICKHEQKEISLFGGSSMTARRQLWWRQQLGGGTAVVAAWRLRGGGYGSNSVTATAGSGHPNQGTAETAPK